MIVQLDLDGVFFNYGDSLKRYMDSVGMGHLWKSGPTEKPIWNFFEDWGMSLPDFIKLNDDAADAGYLFTGPMRDGALEAWDRIVATGAEIVIATDRSFGTTPESSERNTYAWLEKHELYYDEIWFTKDKTLPGADIAIDDKVANVQDLVKAGITTYMPSRPWNEDFHFENRIDSVLDFAEIVENLSSMI